MAWQEIGLSVRYGFSNDVYSFLWGLTPIGFMQPEKFAEFALNSLSLVEENHPDLLPAWESAVEKAERLLRGLPE